jgi:hypothetical protein
VNWPGFNIVRTNTVVPVRYRLPDGNGGFVSNVTSFYGTGLKTISCSDGGTVLNEVGNPNVGLSYDAATGTFTHNWHTGSTPGCRMLQINLRDGTGYAVQFRIEP